MCNACFRCFQGGDEIKLIQYRKSDEIKRKNSVTLIYNLGVCTPLDPNFKTGSRSTDTK
jgi:hypothetical protein